jgi:hypothetical protein
VITIAPFKVIEGQGEDPDVEPELIKNDDGQICMYLALGPYNATLPLPEHLAGASRERLQRFFDIAVPEMRKTLVAMRNKDRTKIRRKAAK